MAMDTAVTAEASETQAELPLTEPARAAAGRLRLVGPALLVYRPPARSQHRRQFVKKTLLPGLDLLTGHVEGEKFRPVDLGKLGLRARVRRPLHREGVAVERRRVAIALKGPGMDDLAALLLDRLQGAEGAGRADARLFLELPLGRAKRSSPGSGSPLGIDQAPSSLLRKKGPPGWASRTSTPPGRSRYINRPALVRGMG